MMVCHVLIACCSVGFIYVSKKLVDVAVAIFGGRYSGAGLWPWAVAMVSIVLFRIMMNAVRSYLQTKTEIRLKNGLRRKLFDILLHLKDDGGSRHHSGDLLNRMQEDVRVVSNAVAVSVPNLFGTALQFVAAFVFLMLLDMRLAVLIVIVVPGRFLSVLPSWRSVRVHPSLQRPFLRRQAAVRIFLLETFLAVTFVIFY